MKHLKNFNEGQFKFRSSKSGEKYHKVALKYHKEILKDVIQDIIDEYGMEKYDSISEDEYDDDAVVVNTGIYYDIISGIWDYTKYDFSTIRIVFEINLEEYERYKIDIRKSFGDVIPRLQSMGYELLNVDMRAYSKNLLLFDINWTKA